MKNITLHFTSGESAPFLVHLFFLMVKEREEKKRSLCNDQPNWSIC